MPDRIPCRAAIKCDGSVSPTVYEDGPADDATWDGSSLVCDACYIAVEPFMRMNSDDVPTAATAAADQYRRQLAWLRDLDDAGVRAAGAEAVTAAASADPGSPYWTSATASAAMAVAELKRRGRA